MSNMDWGPAQALMQIHQVETRSKARYDWQRRYEVAGLRRRARWGRQLLCRLGNWLVVVGERLEQTAPAQPSYQQNHARESSQVARS